MNVEVTTNNGWNYALEAAKFTMGDFEPVVSKVSDGFKHRMCAAEHSPLREVVYRIRCYGMSRRTMGHLVRHHIGIEKYVVTSRPDRNPNADPDKVDVMFTINAQALIQISHVRLCCRAWEDTREVWNQIVDTVGLIDPIVAKYCQPSCVYRGVCPEPECCGFISSDTYAKVRKEYENLFPEKNRR